MIVVHVTHEATEQIGGIGTVIAGLVTSDAYAENVSRTILLGPLFNPDKPANHRLGEGGQVHYSSLDNVCPPEWHARFHGVERQHDVNVIYGTRPVKDACTGRSVDTEVVLLDVFHANMDRLNFFKGQLWKRYGIECNRFEGTWDFEQYVRLAEPGVEAIRAILGDDRDEPMLILAHEYMGVPTALKAMMTGGRNIRTVFYAHEVASVRPIVEGFDGHDTMFYNVMAQAGTEGPTLAEIFPTEVAANYKHPLVQAARHCDHVFAVGEYIRDELKFLDHHFRDAHIDLVFNGIPAEEIPLEERLASRQRMKTYCNNLLGFEPTWVFSHVARPVLSKGLWRDVRILHELDPLLVARDQTAVYFMLGTLGGQRRGADIRAMEADTNWPVGHDYGYPDLVNGEDDLFAMFEHFNAEHSAVRLILVNQFGWSPDGNGRRMPADMAFADIRKGVDAEFGLSIYEPFGISQLEPLSYGATCIVSDVCGCVSFARRAAEAEGFGENIIDASFLDLPAPMTIDQLKALTIAQRSEIEDIEAARVARQLAATLPEGNDILNARLQRGYAMAERMSWDHVVSEYFLPALSHVTEL
jgi:hypothetical protein